MESWTYDTVSMFLIEYEPMFYCDIICLANGILIYGYDVEQLILNDWKVDKQ